MCVKEAMNSHNSSMISVLFWFPSFSFCLSLWIPLHLVVSTRPKLATNYSFECFHMLSFLWSQALHKLKQTLRKGHFSTLEKPESVTNDSRRSHSSLSSQTHHMLLSYVASNMGLKCLCRPTRCALILQKFYLNARISYIF